MVDAMGVGGALPPWWEPMVKPMVKAWFLEALQEHKRESGPPPLLDWPGLGKLIGASLPKVDALVAAGMPSLEVGGSRRFEPERVLAWLRDGHGAGVVTWAGKREVT